MNNKFNLIKNIRFAVISFAINIVLVFISYKFVIYYDSVESLGLWSLLMAWGSLVRIGDVGMGNATLHFISKNDIEKNPFSIQEFIDTGFFINFFAFLLLTFIGYILISDNIDSIVSNDSILLAKNIIPIMFIGMFFSTLSSVIFGSLQGLHFGYITSYLTVGGNLLQILLVILLVPDLGILGLVWAQLVQYVILVLLGWFIIKNKSNSTFFSIKISMKTLQIMLNFSFKAQFANITNGLFEPLSKILFSQYGNLQMQGFYELAYKTVSLSRNIIVSGLSASLPTITNMINSDKQNAIDFYIKSQKNVLKGILIISILVILGSPLISIVWIGQLEFTYWVFVSLITIGFGINTFGATAYNIGLATGNMKNNISSTILVLFILGFIGVILGYFFASYGVVISVAISLASGGILIKYLNEKLLFTER